MSAARIDVIPLQQLDRTLFGHRSARDIRRWTVWADDAELAALIADHLDERSALLTWERCGVVKYGNEVVAAWCWLRYTDDAATYAGLRLPGPIIGNSG